MPNSSAIEISIKTNITPKTTKKTKKQQHPPTKRETQNLHPLQSSSEVTFFMLEPIKT